MSVRQTSLVWGLELPHNEASILMALADHADDDGKRVYPSVAYTAWKTGYGTRQVRRIMGRLKDQGLIEPVRHRLGGRSPTGKGYATEYWLHLDKGVKKSPFEGAASAEDTETRGVVESGLGGSWSPARGVVESGKGDTATSPQPSGTIIESSEESPSYLLILREIPGWDIKGAPREKSLMEWVAGKPYTDGELEASAIGLAKTKTTTLLGYNRLDRAFEDRLLKAYDRNGRPTEPAPALIVQRASYGPIDRQDDGLWGRALEVIKEQVPRPTFASYFAESRSVGIAGHVLVVSVEASWQADTLEKRMYPIAMQALAQVTGGDGLDIVFEVSDGRNYE